jgi:SAM-dependent methyltransferase
MSFVYQLWARQLAQPTGVLGKLMGKGMNRDNRRLIYWTLDVLEVRPDDCVLEIGFGTGLGVQKAAELASRGKVAGIDWSRTMVEEARRLNGSGITAGRVEIKLGTAASLPYADDQFHKAFGVNVHYFWEDPVSTLGEIRRVVRPGGYLALGFVDKQGIGNQGFAKTGLLKLYTTEEMMGLITRAGFAEPRVESKRVHHVGMGMCIIARK